MGDGNEGRIKLSGFIYIHVILVPVFLLLFRYPQQCLGLESGGFLDALYHIIVT